MAGAPAAVRRRRRRLETLGRSWEELPKGQPDPPSKYPAMSRPDIPARVGTEYPPPDIPPMRRIFRPGKPKTEQLEIFKNRCCFDEKFELVCKD
jgi:hypothetical protein